MCRKKIRIKLINLYIKRVAVSHTRATIYKIFFGKLKVKCHRFLPRVVKVRHNEREGKKKE